MPAWLTPLLAPLATLASGLIGYALAHFNRLNAPDVVARKVQTDEQTEEDTDNATAEDHSAKGLNDSRKRAS